MIGTQEVVILTIGRLDLLIREALVLEAAARETMCLCLQGVGFSKTNHKLFTER